MIWNEYPKIKPEFDVSCYVTNTKRGMHGYIAEYHKHYDYFSWSNPEIRDQPPLEVTHWIELPIFPKG